MATAVQHREKEISVAQTGRLLGLSWPQVYRLILTNHLDARQGENGRWLLTAASVRRYLARRERAGRARCSTPVEEVT